MSLHFAAKNIYEKVRRADYGWPWRELGAGSSLRCVYRWVELLLLNCWCWLGTWACLTYCVHAGASGKLPWGSSFWLVCHDTALPLTHCQIPANFCLYHRPRALLMSPEGGKVHSDFARCRALHQALPGRQSIASSHALKGSVYSAITNDSVHTTKRQGLQHNHSVHTTGPCPPMLCWQPLPLGSLEAVVGNRSIDCVLAGIRGGKGQGVRMGLMQTT